MDDIHAQTTTKNVSMDKLEKHLLFIFIAEDKNYKQTYAVLSDGITAELIKTANYERVFNGAFVECLKVVESLNLNANDKIAVENLKKAWESLSTAADDIAKQKGLAFLSDTALLLLVVKTIGEKIKNSLDFPINSLAYLLTRKDIVNQILENVNKYIY